MEQCIAFESSGDRLCVYDVVQRLCPKLCDLCPATSFCDKVDFKYVFAEWLFDDRVANCGAQTRVEGESCVDPKTKSSCPFCSNRRELATEKRLGPACTTTSTTPDETPNPSSTSIPPSSTSIPLTGPDCSGIEESDPVAGIYWEWDIVSQTLGDSLFHDKYFDHGIDIGWDFPNGKRQFIFYYAFGGGSVYGSSGIENVANEPYNLFTSGGTGSGKIYGAPTNVGGGDTGDVGAALPIGSTMTISNGHTEGTTVLRKVSRLLYAPAPQWWVTQASHISGEPGDYTHLFGHAYQWAVYPSIPGDVNGQRMGTVTDPSSSLAYSIKGLHPIGTDKDGFESIVNPDGTLAVIIIDATSSSGIESCDENAITDPARTTTIIAATTTNLRGRRVKI